MRQDHMRAKGAQAAALARCVGAESAVLDGQGGAAALDAAAFIRAVLLEGALADIHRAAGNLQAAAILDGRILLEEAAIIAADSQGMAVVGADEIEAAAVALRGGIAADLAIQDIHLAVRGIDAAADIASLAVGHLAVAQGQVAILDINRAAISAGRPLGDSQIADGDRAAADAKYRELFIAGDAVSLAVDHHLRADRWQSLAQRDIGA